MSQAYRKSKHLKAEKKQKQKKRITITAIIAVAVIALTAVIWAVAEKAGKIDEDKYPVATVEIENYGTVELVLYPNEAPNTVRNFIELANSGFYNGQIITRVCEDFCVQAGSPDGTGSGGPGYSIKGEFAENGFAKNTIKHEKGTISMARSTDYNTAGSQFFICTSESSLSYLDGQYAAFGKVTSGMELIVKISKVAHDSSFGDAGGGTPITDIVIKSITVDTKGITYKQANKIQ